MELATSKNKYGIFLFGDVPLGKITTGTGNGRRIAVIKDSYANAFIPYLASHYEEIYVIDPREFHLPLHDFLRDQGVQEVLVLNYTIFAGDDGYLTMLERVIGK